MAGAGLDGSRAGRSSRQAGSVSRFYAIDDTDIAGSIPYLGKG